MSLPADAFPRDDVDVGGVISVPRGRDFAVDDGILEMDEECTPVIGFEEESRG